MFDYLVRRGLKQLDSAEAAAAAKRGAVLVDVRLAGDYEQEHIAGSISVPMFRRTAGSGNWDKVKRVAMTLLAMESTERNPDFAEDMKKTIGNKRTPSAHALLLRGGLFLRRRAA